MASGPEEAMLLTGDTAKGLQMYQRALVLAKQCGRDGEEGVLPRGPAAGVVVP